MKPLLSITALALAPLIPLSGIEFSSKFDEYMNAQMRAHSFSGSILVAQSGKLLLTKGYGMADAELGVLNTSSTKFRLGPVTQQFTAMAILELEEEGKLDVQNSVCKHIPECPNNWQEVKIVNLLTHTSGIPNFTDFTDYEKTHVMPTTVPELLAHFEKQPLEFKPGEKLKYSSAGYEVLGAVIENVSREPYAKYLAQHIFEPLEMRDTGYDSAKRIMPQRASGYRREGDTDTFANAPYLDISIPYSAGGLYSTVEDLYRWDRALYSEKLVSKKTLNQMFTPFRDGYGFGWKILKEFQRRVLVYAGSINGFSAAIRRYPDDDACVIVLGNLENIDAEKISHDLGAILFDVRYAPPVNHQAMQ
jgi:CubicO group peptidase (beta-lactamase class C family)